MNDTGADPDALTTRAAESERERASQELARAATTGALTLGEYAERAAGLQQAATGDEIQAAVRGLPEERLTSPPLGWVAGS